MRTDTEALEFIVDILSGNHRNKCPYTEGCHFPECDNSKGSANTAYQGYEIEFEYCTGTPEKCWLKYARGET